MDNIRLMKQSDCLQISEIEKQCFKEPWSEGMLKEEIENPLAFYIVLEREGMILSYAGMWVVLDEGHITNVATQEAFRRQGLSKKVLNALIELGKKKDVASFTLEVRQSNLGAIYLYKSFGFEEAGIRKGYYRDGEAAVIMWLKI